LQSNSKNNIIEVKRYTSTSNINPEVMHQIRKKRNSVNAETTNLRKAYNNIEIEKLEKKKFLRARDRMQIEIRKGTRNLEKIYLPKVKKERS
jgi:hypothetical protein